MKTNYIIIPEEQRETFIEIIKHAGFIQTQETFMQKRIDNGSFAYIIPTGTFGFIAD